MSSDHALKVWEVSKLQLQAKRAMLRRASRKALKAKEIADGANGEDKGIEDEGQVAAGIEEEDKGNVVDVEEMMHASSDPVEVMGNEADEQDGWEYMLDPNIQCVSVISHGGHVITSSQLNSVGPKFWRVTNGCLDRKLTSIHGKLYRKSYSDIIETHDMKSRMHGALEMVDNYLVFIRRRRDCQYIYITESLQDPTTVANEYIADAFFTLILPHAVPLSIKSTPEERIMLVRRDTTLEVRDLKLQVKQTIDMPSLTEIVGNLTSNAGKRKLIMMKNGVTMDGRYYIFVNPSGKPKRFIDIVDLQEGKYLRRAKTNTWWRYNAMEDSFFVVAKHKQTEEIDVFLPCKIIDIIDDFDYKEIMYQDSNMLSQDLTHGMEITLDYGLRMWKVKPLRKISTLRGHTAEITGARISHNNQWVVSGSHDQTVRVWSVCNGHQVAVFNVYGAVSDVMFTPCSSHVVVQCYSAPQRKRAAVFKLVNVHDDDIETVVLDS